MKTLHEELNQQLLTAYNKQLIRYLNITHYQEQVMYEVYLHPHTTQATIHKLVSTLGYKYLCGVDFNPSKLLITVRAYGIDNQLAAMRHP